MGTDAYAWFWPLWSRAHGTLVAASRCHIPSDFRNFRRVPGPRSKQTMSNATTDILETPATSGARRQAPAASSHETRGHIYRPQAYTRVPIWNLRQENGGSQRWRALLRAMFVQSNAWRLNRQPLARAANKVCTFFVGLLYILVHQRTKKRETNLLLYLSHVITRATWYVPVLGANVPPGMVTQ